MLLRSAVDYAAFPEAKVDDYLDLPPFGGKADGKCLSLICLVLYYLILSLAGKTPG